MNIPKHLDVPLAEISSIAKGAGTLFIGTFIGIGLKYIFEFSVAKSLGPELFGIFFIGFSIFKILEKLATFGIDNGVLRYVSLYRGENDISRIKGTIILSIKAVLTTGIIITTILIIFSKDIAYKLFPNSNFTLILIVFSLGIIFTGLTEIMISSTQAYQNMSYKVIVRSIIEPSLSIILFLVFLLFRWNIFGAPVAFVSAIIIGTYFSYGFMIKVIPIIKQTNLAPIFETKKILSFSWPLFFVGFFDLICVHINTLMLGYFKTSVDVGIYGAAWRTAFIVSIVLVSFNSIFAPIISDLYNKDKKIKLEKLFKIVTKWTFSFSLPIALLILFFAEKILSLWGSEYTIGTMSLMIICLGQIVNGITGSVGFMIMMTGHSKINLINSISSVAFIVILNLWLIPKYGLLGAAISLGAAITIMNIVKLIEVYIILKVHPFRHDFIKPVIAGAISFFVLILTSNFLRIIPNTLIEIALGTVILLSTYVLFLVLFQIAEEDKIILSKIMDKLCCVERN